MRIGVVILIIILCVVIFVGSGVGYYYYYVDNNIINVIADKILHPGADNPPLSKFTILKRNGSDNILSSDGTKKLMFDDKTGELFVYDVKSGAVYNSFSGYNGGVYKIPKDFSLNSDSKNASLIFKPDIGLLAILDQLGNITWKANLDTRYSIKTFAPYEFVVQNDSNCVIYSTLLKNTYGPVATAALWSSFNPPTVK